MNKLIIKLSKLVKYLKGIQVDKLTCELEHQADRMDCADDKFCQRIEFAQEMKERAEARACNLHNKERLAINKAKKDLASKLDELEGI
ncbi:hypothetical protein [Vibrio phage VEN]|uniref:Uncharacterized protein n=1 Tax=Vibrio phage VEN TaxID=2059879 RepID=A0A2H5BMZ2_9CAUD|nr:hypothetical protein HOS56_gp18 [Vibrio phage VEN]AUG87687.1 hypothetical protein [Vibrio phage VEN]